VAEARLAIGNGLVRKNKNAPFTPQELEPQNLQIKDLTQILKGTATPSN